MNFGQDNNYALTKVNALTDESLIDYMRDRNIPASTSKKYLKQVQVYNRQAKKHFLALGLLNEDEGYELRNLHFTGWTGERDISFIRGLHVKPDQLHIFLDIKDFLTVVAKEADEAFNGDAIVLHCLNLLHKVPPYLYQYGYQSLYSWMPNNHKGRWARNKLTVFSACEPGLNHFPMNQLYSEFENANDCCSRECQT